VRRPPYYRKAAEVAAGLDRLATTWRVFAGSDAWDWCRAWWDDTGRDGHRPVVCCPDARFADFDWSFVADCSVWLQFRGRFDPAAPDAFARHLLLRGAREVSLFTRDEDGRCGGDLYVPVQVAA